MAATWSREQLTAYVQEWYGEPQAATVLRLIERWLERGDGAAVYENHDLGHPEVGEPQITSFGSQAAQLETDEPPQRMPDIGGRINWRYQLVATCREARDG